MRYCSTACQATHWDDDVTERDDLPHRQFCAAFRLSRRMQREIEGREPYDWWGDSAQPLFPAAFAALVSILEGMQLSASAEALRENGILGVCKLAHCSDADFNECGIFGENRDTLRTFARGIIRDKKKCAAEPCTHCGVFIAPHLRATVCPYCHMNIHLPAPGGGA